MKYYTILDKNNKDLHDNYLKIGLIKTEKSMDCIESTDILKSINYGTKLAEVEILDKNTAFKYHSRYLSKSVNVVDIKDIDLEVIKELIKDNKDNNAKEYSNIDHLFIRAIQTNDMELLNYLVSQNYDIHFKGQIQDEYPSSVAEIPLSKDVLLEIAIYDNNLDMVKYLIEKQGFDIKLHNTAYLVAAFINGDLNMIKFLKDTSRQKIKEAFDLIEQIRLNVNLCKESGQDLDSIIEKVCDKMGTKQFMKNPLFKKTILSFLE